MSSKATNELAQWHEPQSIAEDLIFREIVDGSRDQQDATLAQYAAQFPNACDRICHKLERVEHGRAIFLEAIG